MADSDFERRAAEDLARIKKPGSRKGVKKRKLAGKEVNMVTFRLGRLEYDRLLLMCGPSESIVSLLEALINRRWERIRAKVEGNTQAIAK